MNWQDQYPDSSKPSYPAPPPPPPPAPPQSTAPWNPPQGYSPAPPVYQYPPIQYGPPPQQLPPPLPPVIEPLRPWHFRDLLFRPSRFFSGGLHRSSPWMYWLLIWIAGMAGVIERIDSALLRNSLTGKGDDHLFSRVTESWGLYWGLILVGGIISGVIVWAIQGGWYWLRLKMSGAANPDQVEARQVMFFARSIIVVPSLLYSIVLLFLFENYDAYYANGDYFAMLLALLPFWSIVVSYKGVRARFAVSKWAARAWFVAVPMAFYSVLIGALAIVVVLTHVSDDVQGAMLGETSYSTYSSPAFGYQMDKPKGSWYSWRNLAKDMPEADTGMQLGFDYAAVVIPFRHDDVPMTRDAAFSALLADFSIEYPPDEKRNMRELPLVGLQGIELEHSMRYNDDPKITSFHYRIRVLHRHDSSYMIAVWKANDDKNLDKVAEDVFAAFKTTALSPNVRPVRDAVSQAGFFYYSGKHYEDARQYAEALACYRKASELHPEAVGYLTHALSMYTQLDQNEQLLDMAAKYPQHENHAYVRALKGYALSALGHDEAAIAIYRELFAGDWFDADYLQTYIDLMSKLELYEEGEQVLDRLAPAHNTIALREMQSNFLYDAGKHERAVEILDAYDAGKAVNPRTAYHKIAHLQEMDEHTRVLEIADALIANGAESGDAWYYRGLAQYRMLQYKEAKASVERGLELSPNDADLKYLLTSIAAATGKGMTTLVKDPIEPVPIPEFLQTRIGELQASSSPSDASAVVVYSMNVIYFEPGKPIRRTHYKRVRINDHAAASDFSTLSWSFDPLSERAYVNTLNIYDNSGKVSATGDREAYYVMDDQSSGMATHDKTLKIPVPGLHPGSELEFAISTQSLGNRDEFESFTRALVDYRTCSLVSLTLYGNPEDVYVRVMGDHNIVELDGSITWFRENPRPYRNEFAPAMVEDTYTTIRLLPNKQNWKAEVDEYWDALNGLDEPDEATRQLAIELAPPALGEEERIRRLVRHAQQGYTYQAIEFGRRARVPNTCEQIVANKYGDCKDHSLLLHNLLAASGIPSHLALMNSGSSIERDIADLDQFDHMIVAIPRGDEYWFIDATDKESDLVGHVPYGYAGMDVLLLDRENPRFVTIPQYADADGVVTLERRLVISDDGSVSATDVITARGVWGSWLRSWIKQYETEYLATGLTYYFSRHEKGIAITTATASDLYAVEEPLVVTLQYTMPDRTRPVGNYQQLDLPLLWENYLMEVQAVEKRETPFRINLPLRLEETVTVQLPAGSRCIEPASPRAEGNWSRGKWTLSPAGSDNSARIAFAYDHAAGTHPAEYYADWQKSASAGLKALRASVNFN